MKKNIKIIIIILLITFISSGCNAVYELNVDSVNVDESLKVSNIKDEELFEKFMNTYMGYHYYSNYNLYSKTNSYNKIYYKKEKITDDSVLISYSSSLDILSNSAIIKNCFSDFKVIEDNDDITFKTSEGFLCFDKFSDLKDVEIIINVDSSVVSSNAQNINGGKHVWTISNKNSEDFFLEFVFPIISVPIGTEINREEEDCCGGGADDFESFPEETEGDNPDDENSNESNNPNGSSNQSDQETNKPNSNEETKKESTKNYLIYLIIGGILLVVIVSVIIYKYKKNNKI